MVARVPIKFHVKPDVAKEIEENADSGGYDSVSAYIRSHLPECDES